MSLLKAVVKGVQKRPQRVVIYGVESVGKTTLAAQAPAPIFLDLENGSQHLDVARVPVRDWKSVMGALEELAAGGHDYRTVVVDSADWAERLAVADLLAETKKASVEDFPYGKGWVMAAERYARMLARLDDVLAAGMNVLIIGHAQVKRHEPPDQMAAYDRYELKLSRQVGPMVKEWADELYFCQFKTRLMQADSGKMKAKGGKERVIYTCHAAAYDAKTRAGLADELPLAFESVASVFSDEAPRSETKDDIVEVVGGVLKELELSRKEVEAFLISRGELDKGQTWEAAPKAFLQRIAQHPERFVTAVRGWREAA
jgi:hypothetical protein